MFYSWSTVTIPVTRYVFVLAALSREVTEVSLVAGMTGDIAQSVRAHA